MRLYALLPLAALALAGQVRVVTGPVNFIALPEGASIYAAPRAKTVLATAVSRPLLPEPGSPAALVVPEAEAAHAREPQKFWSLFRQTRFHDYAQRSTKLPAAPLTVTRTVKDGDTLQFGNIEVRVLATPGPTPGAVSYEIDHEGRRVIATGALILDGGRLPDLYSLQDAIPETKTRGYHGYATRAGLLIESLRKVRARKPDALVPIHGPVIHNPAQAIDSLIARLQELLDSHFSTDALRWYWGEESWQTRGQIALTRPPAGAMPMAPQKPLPAWAISIGNSRLLVSTSGAAFLIDAGYPQILEKLEELKAEGRFKNLEGIWITHYHDDHTDHAARVAKHYNARVHYTERMHDILANPSRYRMPCLTTHAIPGGSPHTHGDRWQWREFTLAAFYFPGQTLYHGALAVMNTAGEKILFVGDSFTPSGIDDYCLQNRTFVHKDQGYQACLDVIDSLHDDFWLVNQHVQPMFQYDAARIARMRAELRRREQLLTELTALPDANYAIDESWARFYPYAPRAAKGETTQVELRLENHTAKPQTFRAAFHAPAGWDIVSTQTQTTVPARSTGTLKLTLRNRDGAEFALLTATLDFAGLRLRQWTEALLETPAP
jgi:glyoxylase-like metal-dependent hydrolase (beta-lactamase superfamily II)